MPRSANQKLKLLILKDYLERQTDEDHPVSTAQLIGELERHEISAERKSVYDDMAALQQYGLDVQNRKGRSPGWFIGARAFELPELKLLVDAVQSSRFITRKKSGALIRKLEGLASVHQARQLQRQVFVDRRVKTMNESIYYSVDKLNTALSSGKQVSFQYFDYNVRKERVFRREGQRYVVSPLGLVWNSENYYLVAFDQKHEETRHYRVDKMAGLVRKPAGTGHPGPVRHGGHPGARWRGALHRIPLSGGESAVFRLAVWAGRWGHASLSRLGGTGFSGTSGRCLRPVWET